MKRNPSLRLFAALLLLAGAVAWVSLRSRSDDVASSVGAREMAAESRARPRMIWDERRLVQLSERDPVRAIRLSRKLDNGAERERILTIALESLRRSNPALAAKIVAELPPGDFQQIAAGQVGMAFAGADPVAAFTWAEALADERTRLRAVREVGAVWAATDPKAAAVAVAALGSEREKQLGALAVATVWTRNDPRAALAWTATLQPLDARALVAGSAIQTWAERDAAAAMEWLADQSADFHNAIGPNTTCAILSKWAVQDPASVREFVGKMTSGGEQARAVSAVAVLLAKSDPVATMQWAMTLPREAVRNGAFAVAFRQWREEVPVLAETWLREAELTAEEKLRLVNYP